MGILVNRHSKKNILFLLIIFITALLLRVYNINFEDYWFDEQASFWVSDPNIPLGETLERGKSLDRGSNMVFNLILKQFFDIFNYNPNIGRYLTSIFGLLSIPALCYLTIQIKKDLSYLLVGILSSINFYLISYSQELRLYSLLFLLSIISIILFIKIFENKTVSKKKYLLSLIYILFSLLGCCLHIFFFIIISSQFVYLFLNFLFDKRKLTFEFISVSSIPIFYLLLMYDYLLLQIGINEFWIQQVNLGFFTNFFFSRFFGSKIMGLIYLTSFFYLLYINKKIIFKFNSKYFLLILIIFFSYFLPLIYSIFQKPILTDRYIIFVLAPIFVLISIFILDIKQIKIKYAFLFIILSSSLTNNYIEIFEREKTKPEFKKSLEYISDSNVKNVMLMANNDINEKITINYSKNTLAAKTKNINFINSKSNYSNLERVWLICYKPINGFNCSPESYNFLNWSVNDSVEYKLIKSTLYKK